MAESPRDAFDRLILKVRAVLTEVQVIRRDERHARALLDIEGKYKNYRIIISEIRFPDGSVRYAYYVLDKNDHIVRGFDNSPDVRALKMRYGKDYKRHLHERIPHAHMSDGRIELTEHLNFDDFMEWLQGEL